MSDPSQNMATLDVDGTKVLLTVVGVSSDCNARALGTDGVRSAIMSYGHQTIEFRFVTRTHAHPMAVRDALLAAITLGSTAIAAKRAETERLDKIVKSRAEAHAEIAACRAIVWTAPDGTAYSLVPPSHGCYAHWVSPGKAPRTAYTGEIMGTVELPDVGIVGRGIRTWAAAKSAIQLAIATCAVVYHDGHDEWHLLPPQDDEHSALWSTPGKLRRTAWVRATGQVIGPRGDVVGARHTTWTEALDELVQAALLSQVPYVRVFGRQLILRTDHKLAWVTVDDKQTVAWMPQDPSYGVRVHVGHGVFVVIGQEFSRCKAIDLIVAFAKLNGGEVK